MTANRTRRSDWATACWDACEGMADPVAEVEALRRDAADYPKACEDHAACERQRDALADALLELVQRCDGAEGVRADGSNIQTIAAHAALAMVGK